MTVSDSEWHSLKCCLCTKGEILLWKPHCGLQGRAFSSNWCSCVRVARPTDPGCAARPRRPDSPRGHRMQVTGARPALPVGSKLPSALPQRGCSVRSVGPTSYKGCGSPAPPACWPGACTLPSSGRSQGSSPPRTSPDICITNTEEAHHPGLCQGLRGGKFLKLDLPPPTPLRFVSVSVGLPRWKGEGSHRPGREIIFRLGKECQTLG